MMRIRALFIIESAPKMKGTARAMRDPLDRPPDACDEIAAFINDKYATLWLAEHPFEFADRVGSGNHSVSTMECGADSPKTASGYTLQRSG